MSSTYSSYKIELMATGEQSGVWGTKTNTNLGTAIEQAIGGYVSVAKTDATQALTLTDTNAAQNARALYINLTGALTADQVLELPAIQKSYVIKNATTGGYAVTVKVTGMTGVSVPNGRTMSLYNNGTDVVLAFDYVSLYSAYISSALGIGTSSPAYQFDMQGTGLSIRGRVVNSGTSAGDDAYFGVQTFATGTTDTKAAIIFGDGDNQQVGRVLYRHGDDSMAFYTNGSEKVRILSTGYVGIGTTTPLFQLDVSGTGADTFFRHINTGTTASDDSIVSVQTSSTGTTATVSGLYFGDGDSQTIGKLWYQHADDSMAFYTNGSEQMRITSNGRLGIGTTTPSWKLDIQGTGADSFFRALNTGTAASDDSIIVIQTSGTGATNTISGIYFGDGDDQVIGRLFYEHTSDSMTFYTNGAEAMRLTSAGYELIGYTSSNGAYKLQVNSQIFATSATIATSDGRYKENVQALDSGLNVIEKLRPVTFTWRPHAVHNFPVGTTDIGFIAQEVQAALPFWYGGAVVKENSIEDEPFLGMADSKLIPILVRAVQELSAKVAALEAAQ